MAVIQRADGTQFVIRCYRETLSLSNTTLFKQHAFLISEMHGYFSKFLPARAGNNVESIFSSDAGFLLAEMVWYNFGKPDNMIYCEKKDAEHFITVIVRDGLIFTDGELAKPELLEELAAASINLSNATIYTYGDIPGLTEEIQLNPEPQLANAEISDLEAPIPPSFHFDQKNITRLNTSLFNALQADPTFELVPIQQAISDLQLSKASRRKMITLAGGIGLVIIGILLYYFFTRPEPVKVEEIDPLLGFKSALQSPAPQNIISEATRAIVIIDTIPGWEVDKMDIKNGIISATANSYGGTTKSLLQWGLARRASIKFTQAGAFITFPFPQGPLRKAPANPIPMQKSLSTIIDTTMQLLGKRALFFSAESSKGAYSTLSISISFTSLSMQSLLLFGIFLNSLPITIDGINILSSPDLVSGNINLTLYGM